MTEKTKTQQRIENLNGGPLPGGGPWLILENCPASRHNTLYAAVKGGRKGGGHPRCICPRALFRKQEDLDSRRVYHHDSYLRRRAAKAARGEKITRDPITNAVTTTKVRQTPIPDMTLAICGTPAGRKTFDAVIGKCSRENIAAAKLLCDSCPIAPACRRWVLGAEEKPGSWYGVYGGMSPAERKAARNKPTEVAA